MIKSAGDSVAKSAQDSALRHSVDWRLLIQGRTPASGENARASRRGDRGQGTTVDGISNMVTAPLSSRRQ